MRPLAPLLMMVATACAAAEPVAIDVCTWQPPAYGRHLAAYSSGEPLRIGTGRFLLAHSALVEDRRDVARRVTPPVRQADPVLAAEHPWEHQRVFHPNILPDPRTGGLRMWYGTLPTFKAGEPVPSYTLLYAESQDGLTWHKPLLDVVPDGSHARTNIVYRGANGNCSGFRVVADSREADATKAFKMLHKGGVDRNGVLGEELAFSPDGLRWRPFDGNPVMPMRHDCNLNLLHDPGRRVWTAYGRPSAWASGRWLPGDHPRRRIAVAESPDLIHWSKVRTVLGPAEGDSNEFDNITVIPCGNVLVGLLGIFQVANGDQLQQFMHIEPAFSIDGVTWERLPGRPVLLGPSGRDGAFDRDSVSAATAAVVDPTTGDWLLYYNGIEGSGGAARSAIGVMRVRPDRFVAQQAGPAGGWLLTREFVLEGNSLSVNCQAAGAVRVEMAEYPGRPLPGFSAEECDPITGDHLSHPVTWRGGQGDLSELRGRPVYLRFRLEDASLWAFTLRND
jgi:hypothetical protein